MLKRIDFAHQALTRIDEADEADNADGEASSLRDCVLLDLVWRWTENSKERKLVPGDKAGELKGGYKPRCGAFSRHAQG